MEITPDYAGMLEELRSWEGSDGKIPKEYANLFEVTGEISFDVSQAEFDLFYEMYANDIPPLPQVRLQLSQDLLLSKCCFHGAQELFDALGNYRDSEALAASVPEAWEALLEDQYQIGQELLTAGDYEAAQEAFQSVGSYRDSGDMALSARNHAAYTLARLEQAQGNHQRALQIYRLLGDFEDAAEQMAAASRELLQSVAVGDYVSFGAYEQDNDISNGAEAVEWLVLDRIDNRVLVISKYALDCMPYGKRGDVTWETCSLRQWLNSSFLNTAFSEEEQAMIPVVTVPADKAPDHKTSPGNATQDRVFLLSIVELTKYFPSGSSWCCRLTGYSLANGGIFIDDNCLWWLRSPGKTQSCADVVYNSANIASHYDAYLNYIAVRPAMWIDLDI